MMATNTTLMLEDCVLENFPNVAINVELINVLGGSPVNLIVNNSTIRNNGSGVSVNPIFVASFVITFERVTIFSNQGGGFKINNTTTSTVGVDIADSIISNNTGNGLNAVSGAGGPSMFNIHNSVIAKNGSAGVQVNGGTCRPP